MENNTFIINQFRIYCESKGLAQNTIRAYLYDINLYLHFCDGASLSCYEKEGIYRFLAALIKKEKREASTVERRRSALVLFSRMYKEETGKTIFNYDEIKAPKKPSYLPVFYTKQEIHKILSSFDKSDDLEYRNYIIILFLFGAGLRASELLGLQEKDINISDGRVKVMGKGSKTRVVYLPKAIIKEYENYKNTKGFIFNDFIFLNGSGGKLSYNGLYFIITQLPKKFVHLGIKKRFHPHAFRHSFATSLLERGADIRKISEILGHKSLDTTQKYTHINHLQLKESMKEFHPHFNNTTAA